MCREDLKQGDHQADGSPHSSPRPDLQSQAPQVPCGWTRTLTHPAVGRLVHVPFHFLSIGHQVLHATILQGCRVRCREDGLDTERTACTLNLRLVQCQHPAILHVTQEEKKPPSTFGHNILLRPSTSCLVHVQSLFEDNTDLSIYPQAKHNNILLLTVNAWPTQE